MGLGLIQQKWKWLNLVDSLPGRCAGWWLLWSLDGGFWEFLGLWGPSGQAGPSHRLDLGTERGKGCGNLDLGLHQPSPGTEMRTGTWEPPLESPLAPLELMARGEISYLCKGSGPTLQEWNLQSDRFAWWFWSNTEIPVKKKQVRRLYCTGFNSWILSDL